MPILVTYYKNLSEDYRISNKAKEPEQIGGISHKYFPTNVNILIFYASKFYPKIKAFRKFTMLFALV
jgi:hypothetical protein